MGNETLLLLTGGLTPVEAADLYHTLFNCEVRIQYKDKNVILMQFLIVLQCQIFFVPVIAIVVSYSKILMVMSR